MARPTLRVVLIITAVLAGAKVWLQDRFHRDIYHDALIVAYQGKATASCQKELDRNRSRFGAPSLAPTDVLIGNPDTPVSFWDMDNPLWDVRYRHPHLLLTSGAQGGVTCTFDIVAGLANVDKVAAR